MHRLLFGQGVNKSFSLKASGKHWKCKEKRIHFRVGVVPCTVQHYDFCGGPESADQVHGLLFILYCRK